MIGWYGGCVCCGEGNGEDMDNLMGLGWGGGGEEMVNVPHVHPYPIPLAQNNLTPHSPPQLNSKPSPPHLPTSCAPVSHTLAQNKSYVPHPYLPTTAQAEKLSPEALMADVMKQPKREATVGDVWDMATVEADLSYRPELEALYQPHVDTMEKIVSYVNAHGSVAGGKQMFLTLSKLWGTEASEAFMWLGRQYWRRVAGPKDKQTQDNHPQMYHMYKPQDADFPAPAGLKRKPDAMHQAQASTSQQHVHKRRPPKQNSPINNSQPASTSQAAGEPRPKWVDGLLQEFSAQLEPMRQQNKAMGNVLTSLLNLFTVSV
jgi:hypothetical protein